jgi:hypothetical protein
MSATFSILRRDLATNAILAIQTLYPDMLADVQAVKDGDGKVLKTIYWGAMTPSFSPVTSGLLPQWAHQDIALELRASVDYSDRSLDSRYALLLQVFEDFCARPDLASQLSGDTVTVQSPPTFEEGSESVEGGTFVTIYRLRVPARGPE